MRRPAKLERLFLRWRERGDAKALGRVFDGAAPELLTLASHLVQDPELAEDLVQETFLVAIDHADRFDADRRLVPWLVGILSREARAAKRKAARRSTSELDGACAVADGKPDASDAASGLEISAALDKALTELPDRYRSILRHYLEDGRPPREIAAASGIAPGTVRVQIHRGLELLRKKLPAELALGGALALKELGLGLRGMDAVRAKVLTAAGGAGAIATPAVAPAALATLYSAKGLVAGASVVGAGLLGVLIARSGTPEILLPVDRQARAEVAHGATVAGVGGPREGVTPNVARPELEATESHSASSSPTSIVERDGKRVAFAPSRLLGELSGIDPAQKGPVAMTVRGDEEGGILVCELSENGPFSFDLSPIVRGATLPAQVSVEIEHPAYAPLKLSALRSGDREWQLDIALAVRDASIRGTVAVPEGFDAGVDFNWDDVRVAHVTEVTQSSFFVQHNEIGSARCGPDGSFHVELESATTGTLVVRHPELGLHETQVSFAEGRHVDVGVLKLGTGVSISGYAWFAGRPLEPGDEVIAWSEDRDLRFGFDTAPDVVWDGERYRHRRKVAKVGEDGAFQLDGLRAGSSYELTAIPRRVGEYGVGYQRSEGDGVHVEAPASDIRLDSRLALLVVTVVGPEGPLPYANVRRSTGRNDIAMRFFGNPVSRSGESAFVVHTEAEVELEVSCPGYTKRKVTVTPAALPLSGRLEVQLDMVADPTPLTLVFIGDGAVGLAQHPVALHVFSQEHGFVNLGQTRIDGNVARFEDAHPGEYQGGPSILLRRDLGPDEQAYGLVGQARIPDVEDRAHPVEVDVHLGGRIRLTVAGLGDALPGFVLRQNDSDQSVRYLVPAQGDRRCDTVREFVPGTTPLLGRALEPGAYVLKQVGDAYAASEVSVQVRPGETSDVFMTLEAR